MDGIHEVTGSTPVSSTNLKQKLSNKKRININLLSQDVKKKLDKILEEVPLVSKVVKKISDNGGKAFLVGGAVRDLLLGLDLKDLDIEVHGLDMQRLEEILTTFEPVNLVGKIFGVFKFYGHNVDWSLPRTDSSGRKPSVEIDPFMSIKEAFQRRDLTINAMGIDLVTYELIDPFNGFEDLKNKILKATDPEFFIEDPLRLYRVMQFIGRFNMHADDELNKICESMNIKNVSIERIEQEFRKLFLKSEKPSLGINWLKKINRISEILPELAETIGIKQDPKWHPEGDVYEHTMQALDAAAKIEYNTDEEKLIIMWAALCHDLGKVSTTELRDEKYISYGHELESSKLAKKLLKRITNNHDLIESVCKLVHYHMQPGQLVIQNSKPSAYKRLANKLAPLANLQMLAKLFLADLSGRNPEKGSPLSGELELVNTFLNKINELNISRSPESPILHGRDIMDLVDPGPKMGDFLKIAYEIQIEEGIKDKEELIKRVKEHLKKN